MMHPIREKILKLGAYARNLTPVNAPAERLDIERTAMVKMVGFLERDGFVTIKPSPTDGRSRLVELTKEG